MATPSPAESPAPPLDRRGVPMSSIMRKHKHKHHDVSKATIKRNSATWEADQFPKRKYTVEDVWARLVSTNPNYPNVNVIKDELIFGRRDDADVWLQDGAISNTHCRLWRTTAEDSKEEEIEDTKDDVWLEDLSTNGTFVKDRRIGKGNKIPITSGTEIVLIPRGTSRKKVSYVIYIPKHEEQENAPEGTVTFVFTDVQSSTPLWEQCPLAMNDALKRHDKILRKQLRKYRGYEVKTEGDAFMVAFFDVASAVAWCLAVQRALLNAKWPEKLLEQPPALVEKSADGTLLYAGIRIRMGIHTGVCNNRRNPVTGRMDYFGPTVNRAARVSDSAHGGQVVLTSQAKEALENTDPTLLAGLPSYDIKDLGFHMYKGIQKQVNVFQITDKLLAKRKFPALRTEDVLSGKQRTAERFFSNTSSGSGGGNQPSAAKGFSIHVEPSVSSGTAAASYANIDDDEEEEEELEHDLCSRPGCGNMETFDNPFGACARCKSVKYCGVECQKKHWKAHKKVCKELAAALQLADPNTDMHRLPTVRIK